jgi:hypothetical protein
VAKRGWNDISPRNRRILIAAAAVEAALKAVALLDMKRRPANQIRGSKKVWAPAMIVNSFGVIPIAYFVVGVRHGSDAVLSDDIVAQTS